MARGALAGQSQELRIFFRSQGQVIIVLFENGGHTLFFLRRIKSACGNLFDVDGLFIQFPGKQAAIPPADSNFLAPETAALPTSPCCELPREKEPSGSRAP